MSGDDGVAAPAGQIGATERVYRGIMADLERQRLVPGQRLVETELAERFGVGRNAVREAMQRLAIRGIVDLSRHRSAAIRQLDIAEVLEVLEVAGMVSSLAARIAARNFAPGRDGPALAAAITEITADDVARLPGGFSRARRRFYRTLLAIGGNRELQRLFPAIGMHIIYSQFRSPALQDLRRADYRAIGDAVAAGDGAAAETASHAHVDHVRSAILAAIADEQAAAE